MLAAATRPYIYVRGRVYSVFRVNHLEHGSNCSYGSRPILGNGCGVHWSFGVS